MDTGNIKRIEICTQFSTKGRYEETKDIIHLPVTSDLLGSLWIKAKECEKLSEDRNGWLSYFCLDPGCNGVTFKIWQYVDGDMDLDYHEAIFQPLRKMLYRQEDYQTRKIEKIEKNND